ncbi:MAG: MATE family efflux transporter [Lachnospiraceae bacterium]|nr:MATE family efflux transporter [Lachnospiraceae bacterium]
MTKKDEKREFYKNLWTLTLPIALQNLMSAAVSASDAIMLGALDQSSLSAVSLATQVQFVLSLFMTAFTIGETILAAQYWGKEDASSVEQVLAIAMRGSIMVSVVFFLAANVCPEVLMRIFTDEQELIKPGILYLRTVSWSYLFSGISQIYLCVMKNSGRTLKSTIYGSVAVVLNLILNAIFIFGLFGCPRMEIGGAALATVIARGVELLLVICENCRKDRVRIRLRYLLHPYRSLQKDFAGYTAPVLANELIWGCGFTMFSVIMGHLGSDAVAANSVANIVKNIIACVCFGIGNGSGIIVGNELGRGALERARRYGDRLFKISFLAGAVSGLVILCISPLILYCTQSLTEQAHTYLKFMLYICSYYMIGKSVNSTVIAGIFCAGGDTRFGLFCDLVTMWFFIVPLGAVAAFVLKLPVMTVYFLLNLDEMIKLPAVYRHYRNYDWVKNLTKETEQMF